MHDVELQKRFIQLRSQGRSFDRIAQDLQVGRSTLFTWSRKFRFEIQNLRAVELESLQDSLIGTREARARELSNQLKSVQAELAKRDLATVSTGQLHHLAASLRRQIQQELGEMRFAVPAAEIPGNEYHETAQEWVP